MVFYFGFQKANEFISYAALLSLYMTYNFVYYSFVIAWYAYCKLILQMIFGQILQCNSVLVSFFVDRIDVTSRERKKFLWKDTISLVIVLQK